MAIGVRIIKQVSEWTGSSEELLTNKLGEKNGKRARSYFFCFDYIWALIYNVSFNKGEVARRIIDNINVDAPLRQHCPIDSEEWSQFSGKLKIFINKFSNHDSPDRIALLVLVDRIDQLQLSVAQRARNPATIPLPPSDEGRALYKLCGLKDFFMEQSNGIQQDDHKRIARMNCLSYICPTFPYILEKRGDGFCSYRSLATLKYVREKHHESLKSFEERFVRERREKIANFLEDPESLKKIPPPILEHNLPDISLEQWNTFDEETKRTLIADYGGKNREEMIKAIREGTKNRPSPLELWILGHFEEEDSRLSETRGFAYILLDTAKSLQTTFRTYPSEHTHVYILNGKESVSEQFSRTPRGLFDKIGALLDISDCHANCILSEYAFKYIIDRNPDLLRGRGACLGA